MSRSRCVVSLSLLAGAVALALAACSPQSDSSQADTPQAVEDAVSDVPAVAHEDVHAFAIGELEAMTLRDNTFTFPNDNSVLGVGRTPEEVAAVLSAAGAPTDEIQLSVQPLLVKSGDKVLLFDTGTAAGQLPGSLAAADVEPQDITDIFISHAHGDHIGGLVNGQGALAFPDATIHMSAPEWDYLRALNEKQARRSLIDDHAAFIAALTPKVETFAPGAELVPDVVKAVEVKGHTPGHSAYLIGSGADTLLYIGDTMHHSVVSVQKPEWTIGFDLDSETATASRVALLEQAAGSEQRIYGVHFPFPGLGRFEKRDESFVWVAE